MAPAIGCPSGSEIVQAEVHQPVAVVGIDEHQLAPRPLRRAASNNGPSTVFSVLPAVPPWVTNSTSVDTPSVSD